MAEMIRQLVVQETVTKEGQEQSSTLPPGTRRRVTDRTQPNLRYNLLVQPDGTPVIQYTGTFDGKVMEFPSVAGDTFHGVPSIADKLIRREKHYHITFAPTSS